MRRNSLLQYLSKVYHTRVGCCVMAWSCARRSSDACVAVLHTGPSTEQFHRAAGRQRMIQHYTQNQASDRADFSAVRLHSAVTIRDPNGIIY